MLKPWYTTIDLLPITSSVVVQECCYFVTISLEPISVQPNILHALKKERKVGKVIQTESDFFVEVDLKKVNFTQLQASFIFK